MRIVHITQETMDGSYNLCGEGEPTPRDFVASDTDAGCVKCVKAMSQKLRYINSILSQFHILISTASDATADVMEAWETGNPRKDTSDTSGLLASTMDFKARMESGMKVDPGNVVDLMRKLRQ